MGPYKVAVVASLALASLAVVTAVEAASPATASDTAHAGTKKDAHGASLVDAPSVRTKWGGGDDDDDDDNGHWGGYCKWYKFCKKYYEKSHEPCEVDWDDRMAVTTRPAGYGDYTYKGGKGGSYGGGHGGGYGGGHGGSYGGGNGGSYGGGHGGGYEGGHGGGYEGGHGGGYGGGHGGGYEGGHGGGYGGGYGEKYEHKDPGYGHGKGWYKFVEKHGGLYKYYNKDHGYKWFGEHHGHGVWWKGHGYGYDAKKAYYCKEHDGYTYCRFKWGHGYKKTYYCPEHKCYYKKKCVS
ncbi:hypothetical protein MMPV_001265 [Pyropia vietnamensis]